MRKLPSTKYKAARYKNHFLKIIQIIYPLRIFYLPLLSLIFFAVKTGAQDNLYTRYTTEAGREKLYHNLTENSIRKNLARPLNADTEQYWQEAFGALELLRFKNDWVDARITHAFDSIQYRSVEFERALLELAYANYPLDYFANTSMLLQHTGDAKVFAMCAEYILLQRQDSTTLDSLEETLVKKFAFQPDDVLISRLYDHIISIKFPLAPLVENKFFTDLLNRNFLRQQIIMYSFQRKNRDYPGLVILRNKEGNFIRDSGGLVFGAPQLARSITNLPGYLTNGNTPEGIYRMHGFNVSRSNFIGPTPNIQLSLPVEATPQQFFDDSLIEDSTWSEALYGRMLPQQFKKYSPLYNSLYAGLAGRTEIIAHGTTIDPDYYKGRSYYPLTPSQGCLCTKEIWNGKRLESNQQKLVNALLKAGGAYGYCVVLDLDDKQAPVVMEDILPYLLKAESVR